MNKVFGTPFKKFISGSFGVLGIYTGFVEYQRFQRRSKAPSSFSLGSAEDILQDYLSNGDLVLFSRKWHHYHFPMALLIKFQQFISGSDFDHCGIIIQHPKTGQAYILEHLPTQNSSLIPFESRILQSSADQIIVIPLITKGQKGEILGDLNLKFTVSPDEFSRKSLNPLSHQFSQSSNEFLLLLTSIFTSFSIKLFPNSQLISHVCPSTAFAFEIWKSMKLSPIDSLSSLPIDDHILKTFTCQHLLDRNFKFNRLINELQSSLEVDLKKDELKAPSLPKPRMGEKPIMRPRPNQNKVSSSSLVYLSDSDIIVRSK